MNRAGMRRRKGVRGRMLNRSYGSVEQTEKSQQLAEKVTLLVVSSNVTYKEAQSALELALETLETKARLVIDQSPRQGDSGSMS